MGLGPGLPAAVAAGEVEGRPGGAKQARTRQTRGSGGRGAAAARLLPRRRGRHVVRRRTRRWCTRRWAGRRGRRGGAGKWRPVSGRSRSVSGVLPSLLFGVASALPGPEKARPASRYSWRLLPAFPFGPRRGICGRLRLASAGGFALSYQARVCRQPLSCQAGAEAPLLCLCSGGPAGPGL